MIYCALTTWFHYQIQSFELAETVYYTTIIIILQFRLLNAIQTWPINNVKAFRPVVLNLFLGGDTHLEKENLATHQECLNYNQTTLLCKQGINYMYQMLIVEDWKFLATHQKKPATYKCVARPWLRNTALDKSYLIRTIIKSDEQDFCSSSVGLLC